MEKQNTDRPPCFWRIENIQKDWNNAHWHNFTFHVSYYGEEASKTHVYTFNNPKETFKEEEYWMWIGKQVSELMDAMELAHSLRNVKLRS